MRRSPLPALVMYIAAALAVEPAMAQQQTPQASSIRASIDNATFDAAPGDGRSGARGALFWSGVAVGVAGVTAAVLGVTTDRVTTSSSGNAPAGAYQACVAQKRDPIYAGNNCDALKAKNRTLLWSGVAVGALGAAMAIGSTHTSAEISAGAIRLLHTVRF